MPEVNYQPETTQIEGPCPKKDCKAKAQVRASGGVMPSYEWGCEDGHSAGVQFAEYWSLKNQPKATPVV